ncbi:hypothetical protein PROFUN_01512 [Planoprotostelium fungivorum]|uniref:Transmembrane protein n=1 Tax=Planoprotostelium fungivorum TaxID=1890364 RepID=A0A2P6NTJ6_9EUKA|nr:hypothetical protein PROFUN_01512 [Planoprotostelium fungivorum]
MESKLEDYDEEEVDDSHDRIFEQARNYLLYYAKDPLGFPSYTKVQGAWTFDEPISRDQLEALDAGRSRDKLWIIIFLNLVAVVFIPIGIVLLGIDQFRTSLSFLGIFIMVLGTIVGSILFHFWTGRALGFKRKTYEPGYHCCIIGRTDDRNGVIYAYGKVTRFLGEQTKFHLEKMTELSGVQKLELHVPLPFREHPLKRIVPVPDELVEDLVECLNGLGCRLFCTNDVAKSTSFDDDEEESKIAKVGFDPTTLGL